MNYVRSICLLFLAVGTAAHAGPIEVAYEIGPYSSGGFSASSLHTSTGCEGTGPDSGQSLYMCGYVMSSISGTITGLLDGGIVSVNGGSLDMMGKSYHVLGGNLGGDFTDGNKNLLWYLDIEWFGRFYFENLAMGAGMPNIFDGDSLVLWGQNEDAYGCSGGGTTTTKTDCSPWGMDLYGERVGVPEPGTLALLVMGLAGIGAARRRAG